MNTSRIPVNSKQLPYDPNRLLPEDTNILTLEDGTLSRRSTDSFAIPTNNRRQQHSNTEIFGNDDRMGNGVMSTVREDEPYSETAPIANNLVAGILDAETVAKHVSKVGKTADASTIAYLTLTLPVSSLEKLSFTQCNSPHRVTACVIFQFLVITLIYNELNCRIITYLVRIFVEDEELFDFSLCLDLSPLDSLSYLLELDVSNNKIRKLFDFWPPCNLKEADFSFNLIEEIRNLDNFHYLQKLILDSTTFALVNARSIAHLSS